MSEAVDAAVYTVRAPVSAAVPPRFSRLRLRFSTPVTVGRHRSPPNHRATDAGVHARRVTRCRCLHHKSCRAAVHVPVSPRHAFPDRLPCAGEVAAVGHACRATAAR
jgi:hypothetical protein